MTLSSEWQHFEETVSTCRFGQRCGKVKVQISVNAEVGLSDQLRNLGFKIKTLERQVHEMEKQKNKVIATLEAERVVNRKIVEIRMLRKTHLQDDSDELIGGFRRSN